MLLLVGVVGGVAYWYGMQQNGSGSPAAAQPTLVPSMAPAEMNASPVPSTATGTEQAATDANVVPPDNTTVNFARATDGVLISYRGKLYQRGQNGGLEENASLQGASYTWYGLVKAPDFVPAGVFMKDEPFDLLQSPNGKDFVFVMRWNPETPPGSTSDDFYMYRYSPSSSEKVSLIKKFSNSAPYEGGFFAPRLTAYSEATPTLLAVSLFPCWNCGGGSPATLLIDTATSQMKFLGKITGFTWKTDRNYSFREYKEIPCETESMGPCLEKPENLPEQNGSF